MLITKNIIGNNKNFEFPFLLSILNIVIFINIKQAKDTISDALIVKNKIKFDKTNVIFTLLFSRYARRSSTP
jgi:hypothetical protein